MSVKATAASFASMCKLKVTESLPLEEGAPLRLASVHSRLSLAEHTFFHQLTRRNLPMTL